MAPSGSLEPEPSRSTRAPAATRSGAAMTGSGGAFTVTRRRVSMVPQPSVGAGEDGAERDGVHPRLGEGVGDLLAGGGGAVAEVPVEAGAGEVAFAGEPRSEAGRGGVGGAVGADDLDARRLDHGHDGLGGVERAAGAAGVAGDGQGDGVAAGALEDVGRALAAARGAVAEVPGEGVDRAVGVGRARAVEAHGLVGAGHDRRRRRRRSGASRTTAAMRSLWTPMGRPDLVAHGQGDGVDAGLLVGLVRVDDVRAGAVAEVPVVAQEAAVGVARGASRRRGWRRPSRRRGCRRRPRSGGRR